VLVSNTKKDLETKEKNPASKPKDHGTYFDKGRRRTGLCLSSLGTQCLLEVEHHTKTKGGEDSRDRGSIDHQRGSHRCFRELNKGVDKVWLTESGQEKNQGSRKGPCLTNLKSGGEGPTLRGLSRSGEIIGVREKRWMRPLKGVK